MKKYLLPALLSRVRLPVLGAVPWNLAALSGFAVLGLENPAFWAAGGALEVLWLASTTGRPGWRRRVDARERRQAWRELEAGRLALYNRLGPAGQARHHALRVKCQAHLPVAGPVAAPDPPPGTAFSGPPRAGPSPAELRAMLDLFAWLHLKLLLVREAAAAGHPPAVNTENLHRLRAAVLVDLDDPAAVALASHALDILETRLPVSAEEVDGLLRIIEESVAHLLDPRRPPLPTRYPSPSLTESSGEVSTGTSASTAAPVTEYAAPEN